MKGKLEIEVRHSDYGEDAGGYRVLRFEGEWLGRVTDSELAERLIAYVESLEQALQGVMKAVEPLVLAVVKPYATEKSKGEEG